MKGAAALIPLIAALISTCGTVAAAVITTRRNGPAAVADPPVALAGAAGLAHSPGTGRTSRSLWCGIAGLVLWLIPIACYCVVIPGLWIAIREQGGERRHTAAGMALCIGTLILAVINSAIGAYQGAHGTGWWQ